MEEKSWKCSKKKLEFERLQFHNDRAKEDHVGWSIALEGGEIKVVFWRKELWMFQHDELNSYKEKKSSEGFFTTWWPQFNFFLSLIYKAS